MAKLRNKHKISSPLGAQRSAGLLLHITSLPGPFGCGDIGPEARKFADFLRTAGQSYWQILPLNPVESKNAYSPYSSISSMAGNTLLISPEVLVDEGLLTRNDLRRCMTDSGDKADFKNAEEIKDILFEKAFASFSRSRSKIKRKSFDQFCLREKFWLEDYALYSTIKKIQNNKPWFEWPADLKNRNTRSLQKIRAEYPVDIEKIKWLQFVFFQQWDALKKYSNAIGIRLFGDLPFYISHDSADVWSFPEIFSLEKDGRARFVAGVPPDYFNKNGQLWGMPVFNWNVLKRKKYAWWIARLRKNMALYDLLRLDHFRAFADYWAVHGSEKTARKGSWEKGPGQGFFGEAAIRLGHLPFVAEDLGDINDDVSRLREKFQFPGMKVLQFAFGGKMGTSEYLPHNYQSNFLVYTGTHDNNTTVGWYKKDLSKPEKANVKKYLGQKVTSGNVHRLMIREAYASVAKLAIVPVQDLLGLDEKARFNAPATIQGNWIWRLRYDALTTQNGSWLKEQTSIFNRELRKI